MDRHERPTQPPGLPELEHDVRRLDLAARIACSSLLEAIRRHPDTSEAFERWERAKERHAAAQARLDVLKAARADKRRREADHG